MTKMYVINEQTYIVYLIQLAISASF